MAERSNIEWCDSTFNPWVGCTKISPACDHCYAERQDTRFSRESHWGSGVPRRRTMPANWRQPLKWNARAFEECADCGWRGDQHPTHNFCPRCDGESMRPARRRVFCASLADVFDNEIDPQWREDLWELIARTPNLDWLLLTKRIGNVPGMLPVTDSRVPGYRPWNYPWPWPNVWIGATVANQAEADRDIPKLLAIPARVRFLSIEPMLGRVDLCEPLGMWWNQTMGCFESNSDRFNPRNLGWVIAGGESGASARPVHPDWLRSLRNQCAAAGVPFLFKQWGEWVEGMQRADWQGVANDGTLLVGAETLDVVPMSRVGKKAAGRLLEGVEHNGFPESAYD